MVGATDAGSRLVGRHIIEAIGDCFADGVAGNVVHPRLLWRRFRLAFLACVLEVSDQFLLLGVDEIPGCLRSRNSAALALICSNCALRSGCELPSRLLRTDCRL